MLDKLSELEQKYQDISEKVNRPEVISNQNEFKALMKEISGLTPIVDKYRELKKAMKELDDNKEMYDAGGLDPEMKELCFEEIEASKELIETLNNEIKILLLPKDPNDDKNVIVEIRGGAGGDEAALFAGVLFRMYSRYAERNRWKTELMSFNENDLGGYKEIIFMINGKGAYSRLKYESGVHRVQRIPATESSGRIHTSTVTVAVLPEVEEVDVDLDPADVRVDVFRSSGNGGQSVNTTDSAVRLTHIPTGIVISMQDEKSQLKNRDKAFKVLRAKLYEAELEKQQGDLSAQRRSQVGTGDRSERIRTYNYPQGRVSDHRVNLTLYRIDAILDGELDEFMDTLITSAQAELLKGGTI